MLLIQLLINIYTVNNDIFKLSTVLGHQLLWYHCAW